MYRRSPYSPISCPILARKSYPTSSGSDLRVPEGVWQSLCDEALHTPLTEPAARAFFERRFTPYRINNNGKEPGLFTGYYEPVLFGSLHKTRDFKYPVYAAPTDLQRTSRIIRVLASITERSPASILSLPGWMIR